MEEYLVIRKTRTNEEPTFSPIGDDSAFMVEIQNLDDYEAHELSSEDDIDVLTRAMPLKLIAPITSASSEDELSSDGVAWGIKAVKSDQSEYDGSGIVVAVLDTGIDSTHECFEGINLVERDFTGTSTADTDGHGTHCAGIIFGRSRGVPRFGVAPGVSKALIGKVLGGEDGGSTAVIKRAIDWAIENGANVISMSLGIDFPGHVDWLVRAKNWPTDFATSVALEDYRSTIRFFDRLSALIHTSTNAPLIIAAAGNESRRPNFPIDVAPPAAADHFLSVAAIGTKEGKYAVARFSNSNALCAAPGVNILSAKAGGGYVMMSGTSMAVPHVAGVAALWGQYLEKFDQDELWSRLRGTARKFDLKRSDVGCGIVQAPTWENS